MDNGNSIVCVLLSTWRHTSVALTAFFPDGSTDSKLVVESVLATIDEYDLNPRLFRGLCGDNGSYMVKACEDILQLPHFQNGIFTLPYVRCLAHGLNLFAKSFVEAFPNVDKLVLNIGSYLKAGQPYKRRQRYRGCVGGSLSALDVVPTRWSSWLRAHAVSEISNTWDLLISFVKEEETSKRRDKILRLMTVGNAKASIRLIQRETTLLIRLTTVSQGVLTKRDISDLETLLVLFQSYSNSGILQDTEKGRQLLERKLAQYADVWSQCPQCNPSLVLHQLKIAGQSCIARWKYITDTLQIAKTRTLFCPMEDRSCRMLEYADIFAPIDSELQAEWLRYSGLGVVEETTDIFWSDDSVQKDFPLLFRLATLWLCVPTSSASVERSFSVLKNFHTANRHQMADSYVAMELILRYNREYLNTLRE